MLTADLQEVSGKGGCSLPGMQGKQRSDGRSLLIRFFAMNQKSSCRVLAGTRRTGTCLRDGSECTHVCHAGYPMLSAVLRKLLQLLDVADWQVL